MRIKYFKNKKKENTNYFLPFNYCCVSLRPLNTCKNICCDRDGNLFNKFYFLSYVTKFHKNPVTGKKKVSMKDIITLNISQDKSGNFICPITLKVLNNSLKIIAIPETGNVYSYTAYQELNLSMNNFKDLKSDVPFDKNNVIILNDPQKRKIVKNFYFQTVVKEKDYMNKLVNNKIDLDMDENNLIDYKYQKIVNDIENDENKEEKNLAPGPAADRDSGSSGCDRELLCTRSAGRLPDSAAYAGGHQLSGAAGRHAAAGDGAGAGPVSGPAGHLAVGHCGRGGLSRRPPGPDGGPKAARAGPGPGTAGGGPGRGGPGPADGAGAGGPALG